MKSQWKTSYLLQLKGIDDQHKKLIELSEQIMKIAMSTKGMETQLKTQDMIEELKMYAHFHFEFEEDLMLRNDYHGYMEHCELHQEFKFQLQKFENEFKIQYDIQLVINILEFTTSWIVKHIMQEDRLYAQDFRNRGLLLFTDNKSGDESQ